jgi:hypothetical protein
VPKAPTREEARVPDEELDGAAQLAVGQGPDQDVVAGQPVGERGVAGALTEMIGANGEHHRSVPLGGEVEQAADELFPLATVDAGGKRLLELVDEHDPGPIRRPVSLEALGQLAGGVWARAQHGRAPASASRQHSGGQRRQQPRPDQR